MAMTARRKRPDPNLLPSLSFGRPLVGKGRKIIIAPGPSGWNETFVKATIDAELEAFLKPLAPTDVVEIFVMQRELSTDRELEDWHTIIGFLGRTMNTTPLAVPPGAAIAFWVAFLEASVN